MIEVEITLQEVYELATAPGLFVTRGPVTRKAVAAPCVRDAAALIREAIGNPEKPTQVTVRAMRNGRRVNALRSSSIIHPEPTPCATTP